MQHNVPAHAQVHSHTRRRLPWYSHQPHPTTPLANVNSDILKPCRGGRVRYCFVLDILLPCTATARTRISHDSNETLTRPGVSESHFVSSAGAISDGGDCVRDRRASAADAIQRERMESSVTGKCSGGSSEVHIGNFRNTEERAQHAGGADRAD